MTLPVNFEKGLLARSPNEQFFDRRDSNLNNSDSRKRLFQGIFGSPDSQSANEYEYRIKPITQPLFSGMPELSQIEQGAHGHCFLAGALIAILHHTPLDIMTCMKENPDGSVDVRLYDDNMQPAIYRVDKTDLLPTQPGASFHSSAPWFAILLKAYGFHLQRTNPKYANKDILDATSGGVAYRAMSAITGSPAKRFQLTTVCNDLFKDLKKKEFQTLMSTGFAEDKIKSLLKDILDRRENEIQKGNKGDETLSKELILLSNTLMNIDVLNKGNADDSAIEACRDSINKAIQRLETLKGNTKYEAMAKEYLMQFNSYKSAILDYTRKVGDLSLQLYREGKSGEMPKSKMDPEVSKELYSVLRSHLKTGSQITAATKEEFPDAKKVDGHIEKTHQGLVANHAYAVLDIRQRIVNGKEETFIVVGNPWKEYAARQRMNEQTGKLEYQESNEVQSHYLFSMVMGKNVGRKKCESKMLLTAEGLNAQSSDYSGVSEIELSRFLENFDCIDVCPPKDFSNVLLNQCHIMLQHAATLSGTKVTEEMNLSELSQQLLDIMANSSFPAVKKIKAIAGINFNDAKFDAIAKNNPIFNEFRQVITPLYDALSRRIMSDETIERMVQETMLPNMQAAGAKISENYLLIVQLFDYIQKEMQCKASFIASQYSKVINDKNASIPEKLNHLKTLVDSHKDSFLHKMKAGRSEFFNHVSQELNKCQTKFNSWDDAKSPAKLETTSTVEYR